MGEQAGSIGSALIGAGASYLSSREAGKRQEEAASKVANAKLLAEQRANKSMKEAEKRAADRMKQMDANAERRAQEALIPEGESATIDFGGSSGRSTGSAADFLVPKIGKSQLGGSSRSGLGV